ncbi:MAG: DUF3108 domain-containing protein [Rhodoferax sp.]|nr:DUF3108 domain-containing protein [Rhodoferax sp.]
MRKLLMLVVVVALLHGAVLETLPLSVRFAAGARQSDNAPLLRGSLVPHSITPPAGPVLAPAARPKPARAPADSGRKQEAPQVSPEPGNADARATEATAPANTSPEESAASADPSPATEPPNRADSIATAAPSTPAVTPEAPPTPATPAAPASAAKSASTSARPAALTSSASASDNVSTSTAPAATRHVMAPVVYAPPVLLLFDGRGEEKGYVKYAANAELLWQPQGKQYSARLEISTFGIRLRTWTSKGALSEDGLQPTRFGDRPRGAEQATHFQRDKGLITFSANNPDVTLQAGAQDKLSALLQLSALLAAAPERYPAGTSIQFQAADAHRAEIWDFKADAVETQELPGGTLRTMRLTKEPTVEFDQRIEIWLAPDLHYLPVRLRITEATGAFADLLWRKTKNRSEE